MIKRLNLAACRLPCLVEVALTADKRTFDVPIAPLVDASFWMLHKPALPAFLQCR